MTDGSKIESGAPIELDRVGVDERGVEEQLQIEPRVLEAQLSTILSRYALESKGDLYLTDAIEIDIADPESQTTRHEKVKAVTNKNWRKHTVCRTDPGTGSLTEWFAFESFQGVLVDGTGKVIEHLDGRRQVKAVLDAMETSFLAATVEKIDSFDIRGYLMSELEAEIDQTETRLESLRAGLDIADRLKEIERFAVTIDSGWNMEGESNLNEEIKAATASEAITIAIERFKKINGRSDVQAKSFRVSVQLGDEYIELPQEVILPLFNALSRYDAKKLALDYARRDLERPAPNET